MVTLLVCILCLLNIGSSSYIAFGAITSLSSLALYASYFIAISSMLYARYSNGKGGLQLGEWNFGRWGPYINVFALVYTLWMSIFVAIAALVLWVVRAGKHWTGPNITIMDLVMNQS